jgi:hypothetical protein
MIGRVFDGRAVLLLAGLAAGVQRVLLLQVLVERALRIAPWADVARLALDLLGSVPGVVRKEGEFGRRFLRFLRVGGLVSGGGRDRIHFGHGDLLLYK